MSVHEAEAGVVENVEETGMEIPPCHFTSCLLVGKLAFILGAFSSIKWEEPIYNVDRLEILNELAQAKYLRHAWQTEYQ